MRWLGKLYVQVLIGIALGVLVGILWPKLGTDLKPLGDAFVKLIRMVVAPVIFCTVALGIAPRYRGDWVMENVLVLLFLGAAETTMGLDSSFERIEADRSVFYRIK